MRILKVNVVFDFHSSTNVVKTYYTGGSNWESRTFHVFCRMRQD